MTRTLRAPIMRRIAGSLVNQGFQQHCNATWDECITTDAAASNFASTTGSAWVEDIRELSTSNIFRAATHATARTLRELRAAERVRPLLRTTPSSTCASRCAARQGGLRNVETTHPRIVRTGAPRCVGVGDAGDDDGRPAPRIARVECPARWPPHEEWIGHYRIRMQARQDSLECRAGTDALPKQKATGIFRSRWPSMTPQRNGQWSSFSSSSAYSSGPSSSLSCSASSISTVKIQPSP
jgi:hypothetical protein